MTADMNHRDVGSSASGATGNGMDPASSGP
jgi:hypothetical protein